MAVVLRGRFREVDGIGQHFERANGGMNHFEEVATGEVMFVGEDFGQGVDGAAWDANGR